MIRILIGMAIFAAMLLSSEDLGSYTETIRAWQKPRDTGLRSENGWLTLVGLFWLKPGDNTIGSGPNNDFVLPKTAPAQVGRLHWADGKVSAVIGSHQKVPTADAQSLQLVIETLARIDADRLGDACPC